MEALLLIGSPKPNNSTSESLGGYLLDKLKEKGLDTTKARINQILQSEEERNQFIKEANDCDIFILSAPLYVDTPPANVIKIMELLAKQRRTQSQTKSQRMLAICNCGFPEAHQNKMALEVYRCFAKETKYEWAGGIVFGAGGVIGGKPLSSLGGMTKSTVKGLDLVADDLVVGKTIKDEAIKLIEKPLMPGWVYVFMGELGWKKQSRENGVLKKIHDKPYQIR